VSPDYGPLVVCGPPWVGVYFTEHPSGFPLPLSLAPPTALTLSPFPLTPQLTLPKPPVPLLVKATVLRSNQEGAFHFSARATKYGNR